MANNVTVIIAGKDDTKSVFDAVNANLAKLQSHANETGNSFATLAGKLQGALGAIGVGLGVGVVANQFKEAVVATAEFAEEINKAHIQTGIATGTLSVLHYAADVTNTDFHKLVTGASMLGRNMALAAAGNKPLAAAFQAAGINAAELAGRSDGVEVALQKLSSTLGNTSAPAERLALVQGLMGRAGKELSPVLLDMAGNWDEMRAKAEAAGVVLNDLSTAKLAQLNASMQDLKEHVMGARIQFTEGLIPALTDVASAFKGGVSSMSSWNDAGQMVGYGIKAIVAVLLGAYTGLTDFAELLGKVGIQFGTFLEAANKAAHGDFKGALMDWKSGVDGFKEALGDSDANLKKFQDSVHNLWSGTPGAAPTAPTAPSGKGGFVQPPDPEGANKLLEAKQKLNASILALDEESAKADLAIEKQQQDEELSALEAAHAARLISEKDYYAQKRAIADEGYDSEMQQLDQQQQAIWDAEAKIKSQAPKDAADKIDRQAKLNDLEKQGLVIDEQRAAADAKHVTTLDEIATKEREAGEAFKRQMDSAAADLAKLQGGTDPTAALKQSRDEYAIQRPSIQANGSAQELATADALQKMKEAQIELDAQDAKLKQLQAQYALQLLQIQGNANLSSEQKQQETLALLKQEAAAINAIKTQAAQIAPTAGEAGADAMQRFDTAIADVQKKMDDMKTDLSGLLHDFMDPLIGRTKDWSKAFKESLQNIVKDIEKAQLNKLIGALTGTGGKSAGGAGGKGGSGSSGDAFTGLFGAMMGKMFSGHMTYGPGDTPAPSTTALPYGPPPPPSLLSSAGSGEAAGTISSATTSALKSSPLTSGAAGPAIVNIFNYGSPMTASATSGSSSSADGLAGPVTDITLNDAETNGPMYQAFGGGGG